LAVSTHATTGARSGALAGNAVLALAGQCFSSLTNFGTSVMVARACGPAEYGLYFLGFTVVVFLLELQNAIISTPYSVYAPRTEAEGIPAYKGSVLLQQAAFCAIAGALFLVGAGITCLGFGPAGLNGVLGALSVAAMFILLRDQTRRLYFTHMKMRDALVGDMLVAALQLGFIGILFYMNWLTAANAFLLAGLASAAAAGLYLTRESGEIAVSFSKGVALLSQHWQFGRWVLASAVVWGVSMNFYPWLVSYFRGAYEAGLWGAGATLVALANIFILGLHNLLGPRMAAVFASSGAEALRSFVALSTMAFALPLSMLSLFLYFFGAQLLALIYEPSFAAAAEVQFILSLNLLALGIGSVFTRGLFAIERADLDFQVNFLPLVLLFAVGIPLVRGYGIKGAAWALCLANTVAMASRATAFLLAQPRKEPAAR
jgi:O-antigen/teichoic acid export membrane protein